MKKLDIQITKAAIKSVRIEVGEERPEVSATIALMTDGGRVITDYAVSTDAWQEDSKFDLPMGALPPILELLKTLEPVVAKHCRESAKALPPGKSS